MSRYCAIGEKRMLSEAPLIFGTCGTGSTNGCMKNWRKRRNQAINPSRTISGHGRQPNVRLPATDSRYPPFPRLVVNFRFRLSPGTSPNLAGPSVDLKASQLNTCFLSSDKETPWDGIQRTPGREFRRVRRDNARLGKKHLARGQMAHGSVKPLCESAPWHMKSA